MSEPPTQQAMGHYFGADGHCENELIGFPDLKCGRTWEQHQDNPRPCWMPKKRVKQREKRRGAR